MKENVTLETIQALSKNIKPIVVFNQRFPNHVEESLLDTTRDDIEYQRELIDYWNKTISASVLFQEGFNKEEVTENSPTKELDNHEKWDGHKLREICHELIEKEHDLEREKLFPRVRSVFTHFIEDVFMLKNFIDNDCIVIAYQRKELIIHILNFPDMDFVKSFKKNQEDKNNGLFYSDINCVNEGNFLEMIGAYYKNNKMEYFENFTNDVDIVIKNTTLSVTNFDIALQRAMRNGLFINVYPVYSWIKDLYLTVNEVIKTQDHGLHNAYYHSLEFYKFANRPMIVTEFRNLVLMCFALKNMGHNKLFIKHGDVKSGTWTLDFTETNTLKEIQMLVTDKIGVMLLASKFCTTPEFIIQPFIDFRNEMRFFIVDGKIIKAIPVRRADTPLDDDGYVISPYTCLHHDGYDRVFDPDKTSKYAEFVSEMIKDQSYSVVIDIGEDENGKIYPIEINSLLNAGRYGYDGGSFIKALIEKGNKSVLSSYEFLKEKLEEIEKQNEEG